MAAALELDLRAGQAANRNFGYAVLVSLAAHAALLAIAVPQFHGKRPAIAPGPIVARLVQVAPPAPPTPPPPEPVAERPPPAPPPPPVVKPVPKPVAKPVPVAKPEPKPRPKPAPVAKPAARPEPVPAQAAPAAPSAPVAAPAAPATGPVAKVDQKPEPPAPPADAATLAQYRLSLIGQAKRYKRYPRVAMDNNWEGKVEVRMVIGANGMIASMSIKTSAGHAVLDKQALDMIRKAKPLTPIPGELRGKEFVVDVPVIFSLKEPDA